MQGPDLLFEGKLKRGRKTGPSPPGVISKRAGGKKFHCAFAYGSEVCFHSICIR